jgi:CRISPR-associated protein Cmr4
MDAKLMFVHTLSPLHAGTGQGVGVIDQPIAREKATEIPFLPGSTLKGVFRDACPDAERTNIFGPDTNNADLHAGAVTFTDARLLLLPVRSLRGVFAWVTSPLLLRRLVRDARNVQGLDPLPGKIPAPGEDSGYQVTDSCVLKMAMGTRQNVILEDLSLVPPESKGVNPESNEVNPWAEWLGKALFPLEQDADWRKTLQERLCIVSDDTLSFLLATATEITARIRLEDEKKTVAQGALWYEEALPVETVLVSLVMAATTTKAKSDKVFETVKKLTEKTLQFGGNATVGRGLCKATLIPEIPEANHENA